LLAFVTISIHAQPNTKFEPACKLPFEAIKGKGLAIDGDCGSTGSLTMNSPPGKQNAAKNNFCATGEPIPVTFKTFDQLQKAAEKKRHQIRQSGDARQTRCLAKDFDDGRKKFGRRRDCHTRRLCARRAALQHEVFCG
jgi:hypothetical protein